MNEHAGASCALSVLIVAVFAVLLHDRNPPPHPPATKPEATARIDAPPPLAKSLPNLKPAGPIEIISQTPLPRLASTPAKPPAPVPLPAPAEIATPATEARSLPIVPVIVNLPARPAPAPAPAPDRRVTRPLSSFAEVQEGETLADVATRVYGTTDSLQSLWKANRDQLAKPDSSLARGTLLRTP